MMEYANRELHGDAVLECIKAAQKRRRVSAREAMTTAREILRKAGGREMVV